MLNNEMLQFEKDILHTRKIRKLKDNAKNVKDRSSVESRMKKLGIKIDYVSAFIDREFGRHVTFSYLLIIADILERKLDLHLDRLAKRNRSALLCWYAENWELIAPKIVSMKKRSRKRLRREKEQVSSPENYYYYCNPEERVGIKQLDDIDPSNIYTLLNRH